MRRHSLNTKGTNKPRRCEAVVLLLDWKLSKEKHWLQTELENNGYDVIPLGIPDYDQRNRTIKWRKIILWMQYLLLGWRGAWTAMRHDATIVAWNFHTGVFAAITPVPRLSRRSPIVSLNMIAHDRGLLINTLRAWLYRRSFRTCQFHVTINAEQLRFQYIRDYAIPPNRVSVLHDPWGPGYPVLPASRPSGNYVFAGGEAARDWDTLLAVARLCPQIPFQIIARRKTWRVAQPLPANVVIRFDTSQTEFYAQVAGATIILLPLMDQITAGLIVLIRSALLGRPVIATHTPATLPYFPAQCRDTLAPIHDAPAMASVLRSYWSDRAGLEKQAGLLQQHVLRHFSPHEYARQVAGLVELVNEVP